MVPVKHEWYVFYTFPKAEKVVYKELLRKQYESFLPLYKTMNIWKNRQKKIIYKVLFPGYIFVKIRETEIYKVLQIPKICTCIKCGTKPSIVTEKDIKGIRQILSLEKNISTEHNLVPDEHIRITQGPLAGYEGILMRQNGKYRFGIQLKEINQIVTVDIQASMIERIDL